MLTVFFATHNRSQILPKVFESFTHLQSPPGGWKLVVIDNGSTDATREVLASHPQGLPLTCLFESTPGKNAALNTGLAHLEGDLAVFTDDDIFPRPDWLIRLRTAADADPQYSMFGGSVVPHWQSPPPDWLEWVPRGPAFALTEAAWPDGPTDPLNLFGPNIAIRSSIFADGTRFDVSIGPRGANYAMGSETELILRLAAQGQKAWHVKEAVVEHMVSDFQMRKPWVFGRALRYGRGSFRRAKAQNPAIYPYYFGVPLRLWIKLVKPCLKMAAAQISRNRKRSFSARWEFNYLLGHVVEAKQYRRR